MSSLTCLLLAVSVGQQPPAPSDLGMAYALERSVWLGTTGRTLECYVTPPVADTVRTLGNPSAAARRCAARYATTLPPALLQRGLLLGLWHEDVEVRAQCLRLLAEHSPCQACQGRGWCEHWTLPPTPTSPWCWQCQAGARCAPCDGSGLDPSLAAIEHCTSMQP